MTEERLLDEFSRLNNELVNARRELHRVNAALTEKEHFLAKVLDLSPFVVYVFDLVNKRNIYSSREIASILGYNPDEIRAMGSDFLTTLVHPEDIERYTLQQDVIAATGDAQVIVFEYRVRDKSGAWRWLRSSDTVFERDSGGKPVRVVGTVEDITTEKHREELLREASLVDSLTGLKNRRGFDMLAQQHLKNATRRKEGFAVLFFDLDHFKQINDSYGHGEGDQALKTAARLLEGSLRAGDILARHGGDEFMALLPEADGPAVSVLIKRIRDKADALNGSSGKPWHLEFSIGSALFDPGIPEDLVSLADRADARMYQDKKEHEMK